MTPAPVRQLLAGMWLTSLAGIVLDVALEPTLPAPLRAYLAAEIERPLDGTDAVLFPLFVVALGLTVYGSVQLYRLRPKGRVAFAAGFGVGLAGMLFSGPTVFNPWAALLYAASYVFGGALLGWLYLPPRSGTALAS